MVKLLVNGLQLALIFLLISPIVFIWDGQRLQQFCSIIQPGMRYQQYADLLDKHGVREIELVGVEVEGGQWHATVTTFLPSDKFCQITGQTQLVTRAEMMTP